MNKNISLASSFSRIALLILLCLGLIGQAQGQVNYANAVSSLGLYYPNRAAFFLQDSDNSGVVSIVSITNATGTAAGTALPLAGAWTTSGSGYASVALYDRALATFYLKNSTASSGTADNVFVFGGTNNYLLPVAGDWTGQGFQTIGTYNPQTGSFALRNSNSSGSPDIVDVVTDSNGNPPPANAFPIVGDWVGDGKSRVGYFDPNYNVYWYQTSLAQTGTFKCVAQSGNGNPTTFTPLIGKWLTSCSTSQYGYYALNSGYNCLTLWNGSQYQNLGLYPQGVQAANPPKPIVGKWKPSQALSAGQNTSPASPAWMRNQIIYNMRIDLFTNTNNTGTNAFQGATAMLPTLATLGVTGIEIDPIENLGGTGWTGTELFWYNYQPGTVDPRLGSTADITNFVNTAHSYGMKVFVVLVDVGVAPNGPYAPGGASAWPSDYFSNNASGTPYILDSQDALDFTSPGLRAWYTNNIGVAWVKNYDFDGFALDSEPNIGAHPLWSQFKAGISGSTGKQIVLFPECQFLNGYGAGAFSTWSSGTTGYCAANRAYTFDADDHDFYISPTTGTLLETDYATPIGNIVDVVKSCQQNYYTCGLSGISSYGAQGKLSRFAYGFLLSPFIPRWFMGDEFNATPDWVLSGSSNQLLIFSQLHWSQNTGANLAFYNQVKQLIQIRKEFANIIEPSGGPLCNTNIAKVTTYSGMDLPPYTMWSGSNSITVLASNASASGTVSAVVPLSSMGMGSVPFFQATDLLSGSTAMVTNAQVTSGLSYYLTQGSVIPLLLEGQSSVMQDLFTKTGTINNQTPSTTGTSKWSLWVSNTNQSITETGSSALITAMPGTQSIVDYPFVLQANTVYTLQTTVNFSGPNTSATTGYFGGGFANCCSTGGRPTDPSPFIYLWQQTTGSSNPTFIARTGTSAQWSGTVPAASFSKPIQLMVQWDTSVNQSWFYINGILQTTLTTGVPQVGGTSYVYFQGFQSGTYASVNNILLTSAPSPATTTVRDAFTKTGTINNQTPSTTGTNKWSLWVSSTSCSITETGSSAFINSQPLGNSQTIADYPLVLQANTLYTLQATFTSAGPTNSSTTGLIGTGFANCCSTGGSPGDPSPYIFLWPQSTGTSNTTFAAMTGTSTPWYGTVPAAYFANPIQVTVTWDTCANQAQYYLNGILQTTFTTGTPLIGGTSYIYIQGWGTGNYISVKNIVLYSQPSP